MWTEEKLNQLLTTPLQALIDDIKNQRRYYDPWCGRQNGTVKEHVEVWKKRV